MRTINLFADRETTIYTLLDKNFEILARRVIQGSPNDKFIKLEDTYWWGEYVHTGHYEETHNNFFDYLVKKIFG